jgi:branched-chain amino acid transport system substrate-binding protein
MKERRIFLLVAALTLALLCFFPAHGQERKTLKIGAILSVTGKAAWLGEPEKKTVQMVIEKVNQGGGIYQADLDVILEDDETVESKAVSAAEKLINSDKVVAIIGPSTSGSSLAIKPICEKARVPMVSCAAAEAIVKPIEESRFIFKTPQLDSHVVMKILEQINKMEITKIAIISESLPFGQMGRNQLKKFGGEMGVEIVADETYGPSDTNMTAQLKKIADSGAQAVVNWSIVPAQSIVPKDMKALGMKIPLFQSHGFGNIKYIEAAGDSAEGIMFPAGRLLLTNWLPADHFQKKVLWNYKFDYESRYGPHVSTFGGHANDAIRLVIRAIWAKKVTPTTDVTTARQLIRDGLEETKNWVGTAGRFDMSPTDHTGLDKDGSLEMLYVDKGGKIIPLSAKGK